MAQEDGEGDPVYSTLLHKIDRTTYKHKRDDVVIVTDQALHVFASKKVKLKFRCPLSDLTGVSVSRSYDGIIVLHTKGEMKGDKGDMIFDTPHTIEFATYLVRVCCVVLK